MTTDNFPVNPEKMNEILTGISNAVAGHQNGDILAAICWFALDHASEFAGPNLAHTLVSTVLESVNNGYRTQKNG